MLFLIDLLDFPTWKLSAMFTSFLYRSILKADVVALLYFSISRPKRACVTVSSSSNIAPAISSKKLDKSLLSSLLTHDYGQRCRLQFIKLDLFKCWVTWYFFPANVFLFHHDPFPCIIIQLEIFPCIYLSIRLNIEIVFIAFFSFFTFCFYWFFSVWCCKLQQNARIVIR